jgi:hypothetical protein
MLCALPSSTAASAKAARRSARGCTPPAAVPLAAPSPASAGEGELLVVGPGVLGRRVGRLWLEGAPSRSVTAQTVTSASHAALAALGFSARTRADVAAGGGGARRFARVVFCAPPSGSADYAAEVAAAAQLWDGRGAFVFTSSSGVYADCDGCAVDERTPAAAPGAGGPRVDVLLRAEEAARSVGGTVLRLAGLYTAARGAHSYYLASREPLAADGEGLLNLLHYSDAARAVAAALAAPKSVTRGATLLACDGAPRSRVDICTAALASGAFPGARPPAFAGARGPRGKRMSCDATRAALSWAPRWASVEAYMASGCSDDDA